MSNLLAIPLIKLVVNTGNNEDWIDPILFLVSDAVPDTTPTNQLDIRGIKFLMEVRRDQLSHEVVMTASTENGMIAIGEMPDYGYLIIQVPMAEVRPISPAHMSPISSATTASTIASSCRSISISWME